MKQQALDLGHEIIVDLFAGGGGASLGITWALGRGPDVAVNHDPEAIAMHRANHPETEHYCESVCKVDPVRATRNRPVGLLWASPDCTHHSKAKGGRPVKKQIRGLAWVVVKWARRTRPRCIALENVEEFADWGPLTPDDMPCEVRRGQTFRQWVEQLERLGYTVEHRILRACDYGAPTIRKRLFVVARRDGRPIIWPEPTHGAPDDLLVRRGKLLPWRTAAECIDWSIPCPSIFTRKRPLAEATMRRIARGVQRFVLDCPRPFIVGLDHQSSPSAEYETNEPLTTVTSKARHLVCAPYFVPRHGEHSQQHPRTRSVENPMPTVTPTANGASLVAAFMEQANTGMVGHHMAEPVSTIVGKGCTQRLVAAHLLNQHGGADYVLTDIGMRMLQPRELFRANGFPDSYDIESGPDGKRLTKTAQVRLVGNSVPPQWAHALVEANGTNELEVAAA